MVRRRVKLFRHGRNQAVRIPRGFELPGEEAVMRKDGERLIIEPAPKKSLLAVLATLETLDEDFPPSKTCRPIGWICNDVALAAVFAPLKPSARDP
jgi:antitoxin VapB